ncbi:MAG TPA: lysophospholipid acyltransferase family protein, partial [Candidatus Limnocylindrales bacterium]
MLLPEPEYRAYRVRLLRLACRIVIGGILRIRVEHPERWARTPAIYCFNHLNWVDPLVLLAVLPLRPHYAMFGPKEADMTRGARNRLMAWVGFGIPYRPEKSDLLPTTRRVAKVLGRGWVIAIAGEGRIHRGEGELTPIADGPAFFAHRSGVSVIPVAISGTSWLAFRRGVRVRVGEPIVPAEHGHRVAVAAMTRQIEDALLAMTADFPDPAAPGGRFQRLTEWFNEWPEGARPELGEGDGAAYVRGLRSRSAAWLDGAD